MARRYRLHFVQITLLVLALATAPARAAWQELASATASRPQITVTGPAAVLTVTVDLSGFDLQPVADHDASFAAVTIPGCAALQEVGCPEVPTLPISSRSPGRARCRCRSWRVQERAFATAPILPSLGDLDRDVDPAQKVRQTGAVLPRPRPGRLRRLHSGDAFIVRQQRGVAVQVRPLRWDAGQERLLATSRIVLRVVTTAGRLTILCRRPRRPPRSPRSTSTCSPMRRRRTRPGRRTGGGNVSARMLVVCGDGLRRSQPSRRGNGSADSVEVVSMRARRDRSACWARSRSRYESPERLGTSVLVGDVAQVPTNSRYYQGADGECVRHARRRRPLR